MTATILLYTLFAYQIKFGSGSLEINYISATRYFIIIFDVNYGYQLAYSLDTKVGLETNSVKQYWF